MIFMIYPKLIFYNTVFLKRNGFLEEKFSPKKLLSFEANAKTDDEEANPRRKNFMRGTPGQSRSVR